MFGLLVPLLAPFAAVRGQTLTYDADPFTPGIQDGPGIWNSTLLNFWNGSAFVPWPNTTADIATFGGGTSGTAGYVQVGSGITANGMVFNAPNAGIYTLGGATITLGGTAPSITANSAAIIRSIIAGSSLDKNGSGTLTLFGANTYTGLTTINDGTLRITNVLGLGTNAAGTVVNSGGALDLSIVNATPTVATEALTLNGTGVGGAGALVVNNSATWSGAITVGSASTTNVLAGATLTASGGLALTGTGALTKTGLGTLALTASSTGTAGLVVSAGIVTSNNAVNWAGSSTINAGGTQQVTGAGTNAITDTQSITVNAGGALDWQQTGAETFTRLNLSGSGLFGTGALVNNAATAGGALTLSSGVVLGADTTMGAASGGSLNLGTAVISGTGFALTKVGAGTITTGGANTYSGATTVTAGTLTVSGTAGAIASSSAVNARGGLLSLDNTAGIVNRIGDAVTVTLAGGGELSLTGNTTTNTTETIGTLAFGAGNSTVTVGSAASRVTTLAASGTSRTAGATALVRGTSLNQSAATNVSRITLADTAGLAFVGSNTLNNGVTADTTQALRIVPYLFGDTAVANTGSNFVTYDTTLGLRVLLTGQQTTLTAASTTAAQPINAIGFSGNVTATSLTLNSLLFSTTGQTLGGATSTALTINSGAIASNVAAATIAATAPLTLGNGTWNEGVITVAGAGTNTLTIASTIGVTGSGGLTKAGGGTLALSNTANTYSGGTTINQGTVNFAGLGSLGSGGITLAGGGLQWGTSNTADISARTVTFSGPATLDVGANNVTLAGGVGAGGAGGLIKAGTGTLTLGAANSYSGGTTVSAGTLSFSAAEQLGTLGGTVANGITLAGGSLQAANASGTVDLSAALLNLTGAATVDVSNAGGTLRLGPMIGSGAFTKTGAGTLTLVGDPSLNSPFSGNKTFNGGTTNLNGNFASSGTSVVTVAGAAGNAILNVQGGTLVQDSLLVGNAASGNGAVFQSGGGVQFTKAASTTTLSVGNATGGFGYYRLSGGSLTASEVGMGGITSVTATGLVDVTGGTLNVGGWLNLARGSGGSTGIMTVSGGTVNLFGTAGSILTLSGGSIVGPNTTTYTLDFNAAGGNSTSIVNLNGGDLQIYGLIRTTAGGTNPLLLNFDGGTLRYAGNATTNPTNASFLANVLTGATIYGGGATIDDNGGTITIAQPLLAPTGNGITSIALGTAGSGYIAPPVVTISGGGGTGATAVATVDTTVGSPTYGQLTGFTLTNRGTGYTSAPTITLSGGGGTAGSAGAATLAANATTGGLTKNGDGTLILSGANTFGGPITITAGTLNFGNTATQTLPGNVSGPGTLVQSGAGMTLLTGSRTTSGTGNLLATTATAAGAFSISGSVTSATPQTLANASTAGGVLTVAGPLNMGSNLLTISGAGTTRLTNTQSGGSANTLAGGIAVTGSTLVGYAPAAGGVGAGSISSLGSTGVTLSGTSPVLRIAPALGTSLAGGMSPGLFAKGYSGATSLAANNFLGSSNAITTMTGGFSYLNVPAGGAIIPNVPVVAASTAFSTTTSFQITGLLNVTTAGNYLFGTATDDFGSLQVDGSSPIVSAVSTVNGSLYLSAGLHTISYRAGNNGSAGTIGLQYQGPDQPTLGNIPASAFFMANNAADLATTFTTPVTLAATTSGTIDIAADTTVSSVQMSGTGAGTVLNATGSGNLSRLTINALTLTDSLTLGQTATNATALLSVGTIDNTSASPVTLTLGNSGSNLPNTNAITGGITQSGGGAVSVTQTGTSTWTLSGTNTYTGPTTISAGTLTFG
ncbi:MAG: hypothetical protein EBX35_02870, partial [Planctomycetia bacterium]|nr:hypothetical protein [Planctomycetia bacterium]